MQVYGQQIETTNEMECSRGGDHRQLVMDARMDCLRQARPLNPDDRFALCGRCVKAVSLKI